MYVVNGSREGSGKVWRPLHVGMVGTRGVPAAYGGFETAVEEIGARLVERGHQVTVYCRRGNAAQSVGAGATGGLGSYRGMELIHLPALRLKSFETLSHTAVSSVHHLWHRKTDVNFVFNAANSPLLRVLRAGGTPVAVHVDGLEWKRGKWGRHGRAYYRMAELLAVRGADALIADAEGIQDYYRHEFGADTTLLTYGAPVLNDVRGSVVEAVGLSPFGYHLVVARMEPENHVHLIVNAYTRSRSTRPLVIVGTAPYAAEYIDAIRRTATADPRIRLVGGIWNQELLDQLYGNALSYVHGHSVGGTNPSLLRAMGAGTPTLAFDVVFNRGVLDHLGRYFKTEDELTQLFEEMEATAPGELQRIGAGLRQRASVQYDWNTVTDGYERLAADLAAGWSTRGRSNGRRRSDGIAWSGERSATEVAPESGAPSHQFGLRNGEVRQQ
ncbi:DUF1972 domain-containing protein [Kocuria sp. CH-021]|uniref:DUF1972 domain-containing protein n=1 Tax=Kocuria sp. CH-021 TaxID=3406735 RepID=UPI003C74120B